MAQTPINPTLQPGDKLGYFEIRSVIGLGGMSVVWKGYDGLLDREVAIKQIAEGGDLDERYVARFREEAEVQKKIGSSHANLVDVIEYVEEERGLFIVMEYVKGMSLESLLERTGGAIDLKMVLAVIHEAGRGLGGLHEAGVVHRDLKPANILLPVTGGVKICDYGLATLMDEPGAMTAGTTRYMAPELFGTEAPTGAADLYSLGMIAYEMTAGRLAFNDAFKMVLRDQRNQALRWMKWHTNPRLSAPDLRKVNPEAPEVLIELIERLMTKNAGGRIQSADQLMEVLKRNFSKSGRSAQEAALEVGDEGETVEADTVPTAPLPVRERKSKAVVAALVVLLLSGAAGAGYYFGYRPYVEREARLTADRKTYEDAMGMMKDRRFAEAADAFESLSMKWGRDVALGVPARICMLMSQTHEKTAEADGEIAENDFSEAAADLNEAWNKLGEADGLFDEYPSMSGAAIIGQLTRDDVNVQRDDVGQQLAFTKGCAEIMSAIENERYDEGKESLRRWGEKVQLASEKELLTKLGDMLNAQAREAEINQAIQNAREKAANHQIGEAIRNLRDAQMNYQSPEIDKVMKELQDAYQYEQSMAEGREAENAGNMEAALRAYTQAQSVKPNDEALNAKVKMVRSRVMYQRGVAALAQGNMREARSAFTEAVTLDPDYTEAAEELEKVRQGDERQQYVDEGDAAVIAGDYEKAMSLYQMAQQLKVTPEVEQKLTEAKVRQDVAEASDAMGRWELPEARKMLEEALNLKPADGEAVMAMAELEKREKYQQFLMEGDEARKNGEPSLAAYKYQKARDVIDKEGLGVDRAEVTERLNDAAFADLMNKAQYAIEAKKWREAKGYLTAAKQIRTTSELLEQETVVDEALKKLEG